MFEMSGIIIIEYVTANVDFINEGRRSSRFMAETDDDIMNCCKQLREDFERNYPLDKFPNRVFAIISIAREMSYKDGCGALNDLVANTANESEALT